MKTLKISLPYGRIFFQAGILLLLFCFALEFLARTPWITGLSLPQSYGSSHPHFETQLTYLRERAAQEGKIDCIFIGNSQVLYGIDPSIVEQVYRDRTGQSVRCQNFGLGGLPPMSAAPLARVLIQNFHPSVIIFGTGLWDYSSSNADSTNASLMSSPWMQYQLGRPSLDGWLYENSLAFRTIFGLDRALKSDDNQSRGIDAHGHASYSGQTGLSVYEQLEYFETIAKRPELTEPQVNGLRDLVALNSEEVRIIVIETPFNPIFLDYKRKGRLLYPDFKRMLANQTGLTDVDLWMTQESIQFPQENWYDLIHLNKEGSAYFSQRLGEYLASIRAFQPR